MLLPIEIFCIFLFCDNKTLFNVKNCSRLFSQLILVDRFTFFHCNKWINYKNYFAGFILIQKIIYTHKTMKFDKIIKFEGIEKYFLIPVNKKYFLVHDILKNIYQIYDTNLNHIKSFGICNLAEHKMYRQLTNLKTIAKLKINNDNGKINEIANDCLKYGGDAIYLKDKYLSIQMYTCYILL